MIFQSNENSFEQISEQVGAPFILKIPDGSYSIGMKKVSNEEELKTSLELLFEKSAILLAQAFTPTEFDWRVGLLNGVPLYACKYYMAKVIGRFTAIMIRAGAAADWWIRFLSIRCRVWYWIRR